MLAQARLNLERTKSLLEKNFVSQSALDKAESDYNAAKATADAARAGQAQADTSRSFAELRSPIDGVVTQINSREGEMASHLGIAKVVDMKQLRVFATVDELHLPERLPAPEVHRPREDPWQHAVTLAVQPRFDLPRELDVVVAERARERDGRHGQRGQQVPHPPALEERRARRARRLRGGLGHGCLGRAAGQALSGLGLRPSASSLWPLAPGN